MIAQMVSQRSSTTEIMIDQILKIWFVLFAFTALIFEPLYYFGCEWDGLGCPGAKSSSFLRYIKDIWMIYAQWDPLFYKPPLWLRVLCAIEVFIFGPLYCVVAYGLFRRSKWLPPVAYLFSGALIYSTVVYFAMEYLEDAPNTNFLLVFLINCPWTFVPMLLAYRMLSWTDVSLSKTE